MERCLWYIVLSKINWLKNYVYHNPLCIYRRTLSEFFNFILQPHVFSRLFE